VIGSNRRPWVKGLPALGLIWLLGAIGDRLWFALDHHVPSWDQAEYLTGALNYWRALQTPHWFSGDWWTSLWQLSSKIPPLVYITTTPFLSLFGTGADQSTLVNLLFSAVLLGSVYAIGVCLFTVPVALWAAGLCLLLPGLYTVRLDFLLDFPLAALVTLCFASLTVWREQGKQHPDQRSGFNGTSNLIRYAVSLIRQGWLLAAVIGITLGLAFMVKQPALLFLFGPLLWATGETLWQRNWIRCAQLLFAGCLSLFIWIPWYRANWLIMLSATKRATIDSAIAEHDPSLLTLDAWTYYLKALPEMLSLPLLLVSLIGFLLFWRRSRVSSQCAGEADFGPKTKTYRQQAYNASRGALGWLIGYCVGGYLLSSLNLNKDDRYVVPYLPVMALILAYGITLLPGRWQRLQWGTVGLTFILMLGNLIALPLGSTPPPSSPQQHFAYTGQPYPHAQVIAAVIQAEPYVRSTIGVIPSTGEINQHNFNYYGNLQNFQVYGRQVGIKTSQVNRDQRSLSWFITKTGDQGSIRHQAAQTALMQLVEQGDDFTLHQTWTLPDRTTLKLFRRRIPLLEVSPVIDERSTSLRTSGDKETRKPEAGERKNQETQPATAPITLEQVIIPERAPSGKPVPVTYRWSGNWPALESGVVMLTWRKQGTASLSERWFHDHGIGMGLLHAATASDHQPTRFQVVERMAMLPPAGLTDGTYTLDVIYRDRQTGKTTPIAVPPVSIQIDKTVAASAAPELDLVTQLRSLTTAFIDGGAALAAAFDEIGRINQYDPTQDYVEQARQAMVYRFQQEPQNREFAYTLALSTVLKRRVADAIASFQRVIQLDPRNPYAYGYLAFVNLYDFRPHAAQTALNAALRLNPHIPELHALTSGAALLQGNFVKAWQQFQTFERLEQQPGKPKKTSP